MPQPPVVQPEHVPALHVGVEPLQVAHSVAEVAVPQWRLLVVEHAAHAPVDVLQ